HMRSDTSASVLGTAWAWGKPGFDAQGSYNDWDALAKKFALNPRFTLSKIQSDAYDKRFHLLYVDFMEMIRSTALDARYFVEKRSAAEKGAAAATFAAVKAALRFALRHSAVPRELGDAAVTDLLSIRLNDEAFDALADSEEKLDDLVPIALYNGD